MHIPIWPGSSSFTTGSTPWGFYDGDSQFQSDADKFASWAANRLGYPIVEVELQDINFYAAFEEATTEYSNRVNSFNIIDNLMTMQGQSTGSNLTHKLITPTLDRVVTIASTYGTEAGVGGYVTMKSGSIDLVPGQSVYDLKALYSNIYESGSAIEIKRIFHNPPPAIVRFYDPMAGTGMGMQNLMEQFGWGGMSPAVSFTVMPLYADVLRIQAIEFNDQVRKSGYSFEIMNNQIRLTPIPTYAIKLWFHYVLKSDKQNTNVYGDSGSLGTLISDASNIPYNRMEYVYINHHGKSWIWKYALACATETLGAVRNKYASIPIPNQEISFTDFRSKAQEDKANLITELNDFLEKTSRKAQLEQQQAQAESLQNQIKYVHLPIYIG